MHIVELRLQIPSDFDQMQPLHPPKKKKKRWQFILLQLEDVKLKDNIYLS